MLPSKREPNALELMYSVSAFSKVLLMIETKHSGCSTTTEINADLKRRPDEVTDVHVKVL